MTEDLTKDLTEKLLILKKCARKLNLNPALCRLKNEYFMHVGPPRPAPSKKFHFTLKTQNFFLGWKISRRVQEKFTLWFQVTKIEIEGAMVIIFFFGQG